MRLAVTVGFDATFVVRVLSRLGFGERLYLLYGVTGGEGDRKSADVVKWVIDAVRAGVPVAVDLRDFAAGLRQIGELDFDAVALAGGPRLLVIAALVAGVLKGARIYAAPEYGGELVDISSLGALVRLASLSKARVRVLSAVDGVADYRDVARAVGVDSTTALRHLAELEELGLVKRVEGRSKFSVDPIVKVLAELYLQQRGA